MIKELDQVQGQIHSEVEQVVLSVELLARVVLRALEALGALEALVQISPSMICSRHLVASRRGADELEELHLSSRSRKRYLSATILKSR